MHTIIWITAGLIYSGVVFYAGKRYGNTLSNELYEELQKLRSQAAVTIGGNPYKKGSNG